MQSTNIQFWTRLKDEAAAAAAAEPVLADFIKRVVLDSASVSDALAVLLSEKLSGREISLSDLHGLLQKQKIDENAVMRDIATILGNDPAATSSLSPFLFFKGFHALQSYRFAHSFWTSGRKQIALLIQSRMAELFGVDIHPAARIGSGIMMDHATGIVIGETAVVEDDVLFWHGVTLGGRSFDSIDRHPKIRKGAILGAGSTILGNIEIGAGAKIAAGSLVLHDVPAGVRVASQPSTQKN